MLEQFTLFKKKKAKEINMRFVYPKIMEDPMFNAYSRRDHFRIDIRFINFDLP